MRDPKNLTCWLTDKDGVLVHGDRAIPGAKELIERVGADTVAAFFCEPVIGASTQRYCLSRASTAICRAMRAETVV